MTENATIDFTTLHPAFFLEPNLYFFSFQTLLFLSGVKKKNVKVNSAFFFKEHNPLPERFPLNTIWRRCPEVVASTVCVCDRFRYETHLFWEITWENKKRYVNVILQKSII